jgi:hypothetical protein
MSAPVVLSVIPTSGQTGVVLGAPIVVVFDQPIDRATVTSATLSVTGPGQTQILTPDQLLAQNPSAINSREIISGNISFSVNDTTVTFTPSEPLAQNVTYDVLLLGNDGLLSSASIANPSAQKMTNSYRWAFTTGDLNVVSPPPRSPLPAELPQVDPNDIKVRISNFPIRGVGNDLALEIDFIFPVPIDDTSFNVDELLMSIDPIFGDPSIVVPPNLVTTGRIDGNVLRVTITGW